MLRELALPSHRINAAAPGKARIYSLMGPFSAGWLLVCPVTTRLSIIDRYFQCAVRRRLGIACVFDGPDPHGHGRLTEAAGGGFHGRHSELVAAWRQVFQEAGGHIPDRNIERMLHTTHIPVPPGDMRRLDIVVTGINVAAGLPLFCDVTVMTPISRTGLARSGTSNQGGSLLALSLIHI